MLHLHFQASNRSTSPQEQQHRSDDIHYTLSVDKNRQFFTPFPSHLVHVVLECPLLQKNQSKLQNSKGKFEILINMITKRWFTEIPQSLIFNCNVWAFKVQFCKQKPMEIFIATLNNKTFLVVLPWISPM